MVSGTCYLPYMLVLVTMKQRQDEHCTKTRDERMDRRRKKKTILSFEFFQTPANSRPVPVTCSRDKESYVEQIFPAYFLLPKLHVLSNSAITYVLSRKKLSLQSPAPLNSGQTEIGLPRVQRFIHVTSNIDTTEGTIFSTGCVSASPPKRKRHNMGSALAPRRSTFKCHTGGVKTSCSRKPNHWQTCFAFITANKFCLEYQVLRVTEQVMAIIAFYVN